MGCKYIASCFSYPYCNNPVYIIQSNYLLILIIRLAMVRKECPIIDIQYRDNNIMNKMDIERCATNG